MRAASPTDGKWGEGCLLQYSKVLSPTQWPFQRVRAAAEVEAYSRISSLLGVLKSRARRALKRHTSNGKAKTH
jgi:hypothetical protein